MRKSIMLSLVAALFLTASVQSAEACHKEGKMEMKGSHTCPFMVHENAKELGLSAKQKSQVKKIKENLKNDMQAAAKKAGAETDAVLTADQKAKYKTLVAEHAKHRKHHHKKDVKKGDSCPMDK